VSGTEKDQNQIGGASLGQD